MNIDDFLKKPITNFSSEELSFLIEAISEEFKKRNSTIFKDKKPVSVEEGIRFLTDLLQNTVKK